MRFRMRAFGTALLAAFVLGAVAGQNTVDLSACDPDGPRVACGKHQDIGVADFQAEQQC